MLFEYSSITGASKGLIFWSELGGDSFGPRLIAFRYGDIRADAPNPPTLCTSKQSDAELKGLTIVFRSNPRLFRWFHKRKTKSDRVTRTAPIVPPMIMPRFFFDFPSDVPTRGCVAVELGAGVCIVGVFSIDSVFELLEDGR